jgi:hypothetical protein
MSGGNCGQRLFSTRPSRVCMPLLYLLNSRETGLWGITARFVAGGFCRVARSLHIFRPKLI